MKVFVAVSVIFMMAASRTRAEDMPPGTVDIGAQKQLFLDGRLIEFVEHVKLAVNPPRKTSEKLVIADRPWEAHIEAFGSVLKDDDGLVKMWYTAADYKRDVMYLCYATSRDGIRWSKPAIGIHEDFNGSADNNIVMSGTAYAKKTRLCGGTVFKDRRAPADKRYKFVWLVLGAHSGDGIHWTKYPKSLFTGIAGDTAPAVFWDERIERYVAYSRHNTWYPVDPKLASKYARAVRSKGDHILRRRVMRATSENFETWERFESVLAPGEDDVGYDFYNSAACKYSGADDAYFMHTSLYHYEANSLDVHLAVSRDGVAWTRPSRDPFIALGDAGSFDARDIYVLPGPVRMGDEIWIYYAGSDAGHGREYVNAVRGGHRGYTISRAVLRLDGYLSMDAGDREGRLTTVPVIFDGDRLELNARTGPAGYVKVELCDPRTVDAQGMVEDVFGESKPFTGDAVAVPVEWKNLRLGDHAGRPVILRFTMRDAKLHAFRFGTQP